MQSVIINLQLVSSNYDGLPSKAILQYWLENFLPYFQPKSEITIRVVDVTESQYLNLKYRGKNKPTNVLSFSFKPFNNIALSLLGDLVICHQVVQKEATEQHKTIDAHWAHMIIHGCLHLLGYDHLDYINAKRMERIEIMIMHKLGYPNPY